MYRGEKDMEKNESALKMKNPKVGKKKFQSTHVDNKQKKMPMNQPSFMSDS